MRSDPLRVMMMMMMMRKPQQQQVESRNRQKAEKLSCLLVTVRVMMT